MICRGQKGCKGLKGCCGSKLLDYKYTIYDKINNYCDKITEDLTLDKNLHYHIKNLIYSINFIILKSIHECLIRY